MFYSFCNQDATLNILLSPKSSSNKILGLIDDQLKISLTAPPIEGQANQALISFLSKLLHHPKSKILLQKGEKSRQKKLLLVDITDYSKNILENLLSDA